MKIGFIGLGIMGKPMAKNLLKAGFSLIVSNRSQAAVDELSALGAETASSPRQVAEAADVIITMLPDSPQVEEVVLGANGVAEGISAGKIVVDMSSINPVSSQKIASGLEAKGTHLLDAPVSGGEIGAIEAKLAIMVGGPASAFEQVKPILEAMGTSITRVGEVGSGNTVKVINQMIVAMNIAALSEGMALGRKAGIEPELVFEAIRGGLAGSRVMELKTANIAKEEFKPGFRIELHAKDLRNAVAAGQEVGANIPFTTQLLDIFEKLEEMGFGKEDHSALYRYFSKSE
ncbi:2-hydroxy-3-oxopropionate reductase [Paenibacillus thalictri]|uniref:2-hydroxy-3-oxopropionate reductase n=2 Tax=Paenibacillus thalictri TaxID=2527873 RepID=A0A4Q9DLT0_9BACL|nr:2-hydroxy-3-oxopropionate reductase [Paenibacillus thalictri]